MLIETLRADCAARRTTARVSAIPEFAAGALTLGPGTPIADPAGNRDEDTEQERAIALLSVAVGRPLDARAGAHARRALTKAREGDASLALTHLALAGVGRLNDQHEDARRLFLADGLMKAGVAADAILAILGETQPAGDNIERAYDPGQPRVPAGNSVASGRWTAGDRMADGGRAATGKPVRQSGPQVADASATPGHETMSDASPSSDSANAANGPSALQALSSSVWSALPGTHYSALAAQAWQQGDYFSFGLYEAASTLEAAVAIVPGADMTAEALTLAERQALRLVANRLAGQAFENQAGERISAAAEEAGEQITVKTASGTPTRLDYIFRDPATGSIRCIECKSSTTAPLTTNQRTAFPEIDANGATVVGAGKPAFPGGTNIPPTTVEVARPDNLDDLDFGTLHEHRRSR